MTNPTIPCSSAAPLPAAHPYKKETHEFYYEAVAAARKEYEKIKDAALVDMTYGNATINTIAALDQAHDIVVHAERALYNSLLLEAKGWDFPDHMHVVIDSTYRTEEDNARLQKKVDETAPSVPSAHHR